MKAEIIILNSKDRKLMRQELEKEFGITELPELVYFCLNEKERVYVTNKEIFEIEQESIRTNAFGMYFGTFMKDGFRLSIEGCELLKDSFVRQKIQITIDQRNAWLKGEHIDITNEQWTEINKETKEDEKGNYYSLFYNNDVIGMGKLKDNSIINYLPKARRLKKVFPEE